MSNLVDQHNTVQFACRCCGMKLPIYRIRLRLSDGKGNGSQVDATQCKICLLKLIGRAKRTNLIDLNPDAKMVRVTRFEELIMNGGGSVYKYIEESAHE